MAEALGCNRGYNLPQLPKPEAFRICRLTIQFMSQGDGKLKDGGNLHPVVLQLPPAFCLDLQTDIDVKALPMENLISNRILFHMSLYTSNIYFL